MLPSRTEAEAILLEAEQCNPGPWGDHSRIAAHCAERIAAACGTLDPGKAYILGLLHDIGRKFGTRHLGHVSDGYTYMRSLGYDEAAQICLTHSFHNQSTEGYIGRFDTTAEEQKLVEDALAAVTLTDYDLLIQLCDAMAGPDSIVDMEDRVADIRRRYGSYPPEKWAYLLHLRQYFEAMTGGDIYQIVDRAHFRLRP